MPDQGGLPAARAAVRQAAPHAAGSIVIRMTAWYAATSFLLILIAASVLYGTVAGNLRAEDRRILTDTAANLRLLVADTPAFAASSSAAPTADAPRASSPGSGFIWFRLIAPDGRIERETAGMDREVPLAGFAALLALRPGAQDFATVQNEHGAPFELLSERFTAGGADTIVQVAIDRARDQRVLIKDRERLLFMLILSLGVCAAIGYAIARGGIRPVARIAAAAGSIRATTLHERLDTSDLPGELQSLAATFNDMLDRLEASFAQVSQFSADVAHELRTPVNNLRGELEVALGRVRSAPDYRDVLGSALEECGRINRVIDSLLFLARAEAAGAEPRREALDVAAELQAILEFYEPAALDSGIGLVLRADARLIAPCDRTLFQQAVGNLVANAIAHTGRGGTVTVALGPDAASAPAPMLRIDVADTGSGIAPAHLPHVFDRFYRADAARSSLGGNFGLGLAVVRSIATLHGGTVSIASTLGIGTVVSLRLPLRAV
ncbi:MULTISPECIES: heavy metal sensor histidine kinase [Acidiphilium]|uniref:heavy metal sensor histidine kinase n=1 Tax=Acidiphilium TaxID=522 RepID=UPI00257E3602|nr:MULTISPECIES: heavy metal sensor histidine kinase [Acidiphilium]HQT83905.1 heavy metal sensor histidine kinase [Acidiphilium rubrum]